MRVLFIFVCLVITITSAAQTDSSFRSSIAPTYTSIQTLTSSDIEHLPVFSFMQLVQGAFPFVGNESSVEEEYSFVVNGFILTNPNAINVSQIETISFIPVGTNFTRGSLTKKGTFIIITRPEKNGLSFSTHTGTVLSKEPTHLPYSEIVQTQNGFSSLNDISYSHKAKNWFVSSAFSFLKGESPAFQIRISTPLLNSSSVTNTSSESKRFRFSNFGGYEFNKHWKAEGGFFFTDKSGTTNIDRTYTNLQTTGNYTAKTKPRINYIGGNAGLNTVFDNINNRLAVEIARYKDDNNSRSDYSYSTMQGFAIGTLDYKSTGYSFSDNFSWTTKLTSSIQLDFSLFANYRTTKSSERRDSIEQSSPLIGSPANFRSGSRYQRKTHSLLISPVAGISYKNVVFAEIGASYDTYTESIFAPENKKKLLTNAGIKAEFASLLNNKFISTLEISGSYSKYLTNFERYDRLGTSYSSNVIPYTFGTSILIANPALNGYLPVKNWLGSAAIGFNNNSILFKAQYRLHEKIIESFAPAPWYANFNTIVMITEPLNSRSWSFELKATVLKKDTKTWNIYATTFQDKYSRQYKQYPPTPKDLILLDAGKAPWRSGLRTSVTVNKFFFQASTLFNFNELSIDRNGNTKEDMSRYNFNFLVFGYALPLKNKAIREVNISAETNGLFSSKSFALAKYVGIAVQMDF
jgi:hypothetical protein